MCMYNYKHYAGCGHFAIEAKSYCRYALFAAGLGGTLSPCRHGFHTEPIPSPDASGQYGYPVSVREWKIVAATCQKCNLASNPACLADNNVEEAGTNTSRWWPPPMPLETAAQTEPPHVLMTPLLAPLVDLLHIPTVAREQDNIDDSDLSLVWFPGKVDQPQNWNDLVSKFSFQNGVWADPSASGVAYSNVPLANPLTGHVYAAEALRQLGIAGGMTRSDVLLMVRVFQEGLPLDNTFSVIFEPRGMPYGVFASMATMISELTWVVDPEVGNHYSAEAFRGWPPLHHW